MTCCGGFVSAKPENDTARVNEGEEFVGEYGEYGMRKPLSFPLFSLARSSTL